MGIGGSIACLKAPEEKWAEMEKNGGEWAGMGAKVLGLNHHGLVRPFCLVHHSQSPHRIWTPLSHTNAMEHFHDYNRCEVCSLESATEPHEERDIRRLPFKASEAFEVRAKEGVANWVNQ